MILFKEDWDSYPLAEPNFDTNNKSFLLLAKTYKEMGIKNWYFHLALMDPALKDVDPFAEDLDLMDMVRVDEECRLNPWYFLREILRIKPQAGATPLRFRADRGNIGAAWCFFNHITIFWVQPRQTGKSTGSDAIALYLIYFGMSNSRINMLTKDEKLRVENIERLHKSREYFPKYLDKHKKNVDAENKMRITCTMLGNEYSTQVPRNSEDQANNLGRGTTSPIVFMDEPPFIPFIDIVIPAMLAATGAARDQAAAEGQFYGNIFTTTAGKLDTKGGAFIYGMMTEAMVMDERLIFDLKNAEETYRFVGAQSDRSNPSINLTLSHRQLGKTDEWLQEKMSQAYSRGATADRDYLNIWTSGGEFHPLPVEITEAIRNSVRDPVHTEINSRDYLVKWYINPKELKYRTATLGLDPSEVLGKDALAGVLVDDASLEVLATFKIKETNIFTFSDWLAEWLAEHETVTLVPERRSTGSAIIDVLLLKLPMMGINPYRRIYSVIVDDSVYNPQSHNFREEFRIINQDVAQQPYGFADKHKVNFGFATTGGVTARFSRNKLYVETLQSYARYTCQKIFDVGLAGEINGLTVKNNRVDHQTGSNDDMVIAWLLAGWFLISTRNHGFYGKMNVLTNVREFRPKVEGEPDKTPYQLYIEDEQKSIKDEIARIADELSECRDLFEIMKLEAKLKNVYATLKEVGTGMGTFEQVLAAAAEKRRADIRHNRTNPQAANIPLFGTGTNMRRF